MNSSAIVTIFWIIKAIGYNSSLKIEVSVVINFQQKYDTNTLVNIGWTNKLLSRRDRLCSLWIYIQQPPLSRRLMPKTARRRTRKLKKKRNKNLSHCTNKNRVTNTAWLPEINKIYLHIDHFFPFSSSVLAAVGRKIFFSVFRFVPTVNVVHSGPVELYTEQS